MHSSSDAANPSDVTPQIGYTGDDRNVSAPRARGESRFRTRCFRQRRSLLVLSSAQISRWVLTFLITAQMLGWVPVSRANDPPSTPSVPPAPSPSALATARLALREFDRFLDHHPLLEDKLRLTPPLATERPFLDANPELRDFFHGHPEVVVGLKLYPRYYLYRALLRQASVPVSYPEIARLKEAFASDPELEPALIRTPEAIRDPAFQTAHPRLRSLLQQQPILARAFSSPAHPL